jgi:ATP-binding cassette subfamily F protein 3
MLMMPGNFLLLDEPTNHLDMRAKDVLLTALQEYNGTVVFVYHDRYFIDKLATRVIEVADGAVHAFPGNYEDYLWRKNGGGSPVSGTAGAGPGSTPAIVPANSAKPKTPLATKAAVVEKAAEKDDKQRRLNPIKFRQMKQRQRAIEDEITRLEVEIADFEQALSSYQNAEMSIEIAGLLESRREDMKNLLAEWEEVSTTLEANQ